MYLKENEEELGHESGAIARVRRERKPGRLKVEEVDEPQIEGPLEVIVRIGAPGLCRPCRAGIDMACVVGVFPGLDADGGFAELLKTNARGVVKLPEGVEPKDVAAHAYADLSLSRRKEGPGCSLPRHEGSGHRSGRGRGHIGIQALKALTPVEIIQSTSERNRLSSPRNGARTRRSRWTATTWRRCWR
jgi:hypothetical protein